jgi:hypothetical protein
MNQTDETKHPESYNDVPESEEVLIEASGAIRLMLEMIRAQAKKKSPRPPAPPPTLPND